ncbi:MAG: sulfur-oxidizing protein SoxX, partial [Candidatus Paceibacteria bacterium]
WDAAVRNPNTVMPPYGRHSILTEDEIDHVVDFIHSI